jgi:hypothetical protein
MVCLLIDKPFIEIRLIQDDVRAVSGQNLFGEKFDPHSQLKIHCTRQNAERVNSYLTR